MKIIYRDLTTHDLFKLRVENLTLTEQITDDNIIQYIIDIVNSDEDYGIINTIVKKAEKVLDEIKGQASSKNTPENKRKKAMLAYQQLKHTLDNFDNERENMSQDIILEIIEEYQNKDIQSGEDGKKEVNSFFNNDFINKMLLKYFNVSPTQDEPYEKVLHKDRPENNTTELTNEMEEPSNGITTEERTAVGDLVKKYEEDVKNATGIQETKIAKMKLLLLVYRLQDIGFDVDDFIQFTPSLQSWLSTEYGVAYIQGYRDGWTLTNWREDPDVLDFIGEDTTITQQAATNTNKAVIDDLSNIFGWTKDYIKRFYDKENMPSDRNLNAYFGKED